MCNTYATYSTYSRACRSLTRQCPGWPVGRACSFRPRTCDARSVPVALASSISTYVVTTHPGAEEVLQEELAEILPGIETVSRHGAVSFDGHDGAMHRVNLWTRSGIRVLQKVHEVALDPSRPAGDTLYEAFRGALPWGDWLDSPGKSFSIDARIWNNSNFSNSQLVQTRGRDAICDAVRESTGHRPMPPKKGLVPEVPLSVSVFNDVLTLYLDTSGVSLHKRGFKSKIHKAGLNECAAATMLRLAGLQDALREQEAAVGAGVAGGELVVIDPMCGSGTILTEAALIAGNIAPGLYRRWWPFLSWPTFDARAKSSWDGAMGHAKASRKEEKPNVRLIGNDIHRGALDLCMENAKNAGVAPLIKLSHGDVGSLELGRSAGDGVPSPMVVTNPPWGQRLNDHDDVEAAWRNLGSFLKHQCQGSSAYILSGDSGVTKHLRLKSDRRVAITVGNVSCKILQYKMYM